MDSSFLSAGPLSWAQILAFGLFVVALLKGYDWIAGKMRAGTKDAVSPLTIDMAAVKIQIASQAEALSAFKIEVAQKYVTSDVITRLESRIDGMVSSVREEMRATRSEVIEAVLNGRAPHR
ncbi:hypothetical protein [Methylobacterium gossipiicola]|uniref:Uncharacterized protein n=1 Tax=Methylobacterium gossipiicola TaxID=582675 RepID=A0A1I2TIL4_9HYPH|nr:hypothetical protein [Methylobacterium gossipiicola]SFG64693.1 hypothetical protein SAMN05192565_107130 [Methylobacterium gossipiicola]